MGAAVPSLVLSRGVDSAVLPRTPDLGGRLTARCAPLDHHFSDRRYLSSAISPDRTEAARMAGLVCHPRQTYSQVAVRPGLRADRLHVDRAVGPAAPPAGQVRRGLVLPDAAEGWRGPGGGAGHGDGQAVEGVGVVALVAVHLPGTGVTAVPGWRCGPPRPGSCARTRSAPPNWKASAPAPRSPSSTKRPGGPGLRKPA